MKRIRVANNQPKPQKILFSRNKLHLCLFIEIDPRIRIRIEMKRICNTALKDGGGSVPVVSAPACYGVESDEDDAYDNFSFDNFNENIESSEDDEVVINIKVFWGLLVPGVDVCPKCSLFFIFLFSPSFLIFLNEYSFFPKPLEILNKKNKKKYILFQPVLNVPVTYWELVEGGKVDPKTGKTGTGVKVCLFL